MLRGGDWKDYPYYTRCANRKYTNPDNLDFYFGFRCVRGL